MKISQYIEQLESGPEKDLVLYLESNSGKFDKGTTEERVARRSEIKNLIKAVPEKSKDLPLIINFYWCADVYMVTLDLNKEVKNNKPKR